MAKAYKHMEKVWRGVVSSLTIQAHTKYAYVCV